jgi:hypothetical protein
MPIVVYYHSDAMTAQQYDQIMDDLRAEGSFEPEGLLTHVCFGEPGRLCVCDTWETREAFDRFTGTLMPLIQKSGAQFSGPPLVSEVHADYTRERGYRVCDAVTA